MTRIHAHKALIPLALLLAGCASEGDKPRPGAASATTAPRPRPAAPAKAKATEPPDTPGPANVVALIVLDGVRADHTSLCGHTRETTRYLTRLRDEVHAAVSCQTYATSPHGRISIGSLLTGEMPQVHGLDNRFVGDAWAQQQTLAERYAAAGWQTVLVSGRTDLTEAPGPADGYEVVVGAGELPLRGEALAEATRAVINETDARPLFLTVVISDARDPWPATTDDPGFSVARPAMSLELHDPASPVRTMIRGAMKDEPRTRLLENIRAHYDYGVRTADGLVRDTLSALERRRGTRQDVRAAIVGSSGYFLGERDRVGEAAWLWEPAVKVPLLYFDTGRAEPFPPLPETPLSALAIRPWLEAGNLPRPAPVAQAVSAHERGMPDNGDDMIAIWGGKQKLVWWRGVTSRYSLADDPDEHIPRLPYGSELRPAFEALAPAAEAWIGWHDEELVRRGLASALRAPIRDPLPGAAAE